MDTGVVLAVGLVFAGVLAGAYYVHRRRQGLLDISLARLEATRQKLQSQVRATIEREKQLTMLSDFSSRLALSLDLEHILGTAIEMLQTTMRVEVVLIYTVDGKTQELRLAALEGVSEEPPMAVLNGKVVQTGRPLVVEDTAGESKLAGQAARREGLHALVIVPLISRSKIIGTCCAATRHPRTFSPHEVEFLATAGHQIGIAVENSRLYRQQQLILEQLQTSEKRYRELFENAHDAIWVSDLDGKITAANQACAEALGYPLHKLIGKNMADILPPGAAADGGETRRKLLLGEPADKEYDQRVVRTDGSEAILRVAVNLIITDRSVFLQHIAKDITSERRAQENLRHYVQQITRAQEEERLRIARDLHDSTAQSLIAVLHQLDSFLEGRRHLPMSDMRELWSIREQTKSILQEVRHFSRDLRPSILDDLGLLPALEWLIEDIKVTHGIDATLAIDGAQQRFLPEVELGLFRIVQEALRNIVRHAEATRIEVILALDDKETRLTIRDDGKGFVLPGSLGELPRLGKLGLAGMRERAQLLGGTTALVSSPSRGTVVSVTIPVEGNVISA